MSLLEFDIAKCVHTTNKFAVCDKCVTACPVETIKIEEHTVSFVPSECVGCGGCLAVCPTAAYKLDTFNPINYIFAFLEKDKTVLSCKEELPCIAALSVEELLSLALIAPRQIVADIAPCSECEIAKTNLAIIKERMEEVNFLLQAMQQQKQIAVKELDVAISQENKEISRRELLSKEGVKKAITLRQQLENEVAASAEEAQVHRVTADAIAKIKQKNIPDRRNLLLMALKRAQVPSKFHRIPIEDISFTSQKELDESTCTNCQMCYRICPTGALSSDVKGSLINFNPLACVQCHSCHDVCEPKSLTLRKTFDLGSFFEPKIETLVRWSMKRCDECGNWFASQEGESVCRRCKIEEEEAMQLWGIK